MKRPASGTAGAAGVVEQRRIVRLLSVQDLLRKLTVCASSLAPRYTSTRVDIFSLSLGTKREDSERARVIFTIVGG